MELDLAFVNWENLSTYTGTLVMVLILTQLTKNLPIVKSLPTQVWSYMVALCVMFPAAYFSGTLDASAAVLILFNAAVTALAANGGYSLLERLTGKKTDKGDNGGGE